MFKLIAGTAFTRIGVMISGFLVLLVNARYFGAEGVGTIGLIVLAVAINSLLGGLIGGGAIVYLAPRYNFFLLAMPAYIWSLLSSVLGSYLMNSIGLLPQGFLYHIMLLSIISSINQLHLNGLLGLRKVRAFNLLSLLQALVMIVTLLILAHSYGNIIAFVLSMYLALLSVLLISLVLLWNDLEFSDLNGLGETIPQLLKLGFFVQVANVVQLMNYRLIYYLVDIQLGRAMLGVFDLGTKLSEGVWLTGKSVATVQYSRLSNEKDKEKAILISLKLFRFTLLLTVITLLLILAIPESFYLLLFGNEFAGMKRILWYLSPGIFFISCGMIISHYFAGLGLHRINTIGSLIGLAVLAATASYLMPLLQLEGAAISVSIAYFSSFLFALLVFFRRTGAHFKAFLPMANELRDWHRDISKLLRNKS